MTDAVTPTIEVEEEHHPTRWKLLWSTLKAQRRNLLIGSSVGLLWTLCKISVPFLVSYSIDRGIEQGEYLWLWVMLIAIAGMAMTTGGGPPSRNSAATLAT